MVGISCCLETKVIQFDIIVNDFEYQLQNYVQFQTNILGKVYEFLYTTRYG